MEREKDQLYRVEITARTIVFAIGLLIGLYLVWVVRNVFVMLFFSFILMSALRPLVDGLERLRIPRIFAAIGVILLFFSLFVSFIVYALPPLVLQVKDFIIFLYNQIFYLVQQYAKDISAEKLVPLNSLPQYLPNLTNTITKGVFSLFGNLLGVVSLFFFTLYLLLDIEHLQPLLERFLTPGQTKIALEIVNAVEKKLGAWVRGELVLMTIIGVLSYIGLSLLNIKYALPLAIIAGLLELFPIIGPVISVIPAFLVASISSWFLGFATIPLYIIIQQLENNIIVPLVMKKAVGIPQLAILISLLVGEKLAGFTGILLAVPFVASMSIIIQEFYRYKTDTTS
ncbi:hypothetical protein COU88_04530 [Candidatus Roizmanbacteria bacterium CG10_big_fil_rev_8_21_14_0_10_39_6]|uniref:AI-2E family transporter n=1 Tax=Candidatus Roizmanbacteria bacterium CG10_big_fil_rev_8_21_14_0_10_39_6 TaxID=1974853 RepID=A0A2M8KRJ7_9BACT|nr:MAG: hypothetical protein COU88_04530 [Candidatus Roizmanbacteria bacterium CG10_big_fil_rev_8_21_14_0_10_39_6]